MLDIRRTWPGVFTLKFLNKRTVFPSFFKFGAPRPQPRVRSDDLDKIFVTDDLH